MNKYLYFIFILLYSIHVSGQIPIDKKWAKYVAKDQVPKSFLPLKNTTATVLVRLPSMQRSFFTKNNIPVLRILDREHYIVSLPGSQKLTANKTLAISLVNNQWKLSESLQKDNTAITGHYVLRSMDMEKTKRSLQGNPEISILGQTKDYLYLHGPLDKIKAYLLPLTEIVYIGQESFDPIQESTVLDLNLGINNINKIYSDYPNLNGTGITVSVKDNRYFEGDIDLIGKLTASPLQSDIFEQHPTDMSTIISGLGNSSINGRGVAPGALLQSSNFLNLPPDDNTYLSDRGIFIQNHSYGTMIENFYGSLAASYDQHIFENPNELHIFSSGNAGGTVPEDGNYRNLGNFANLTGNFKMAKNNLIIGAVNEENGLSPFSSKGPAYDGRIKPELVSYSIIGTSNATALTSGLSALLQQAYQETHNAPLPASLAKAVLINSANDIGTKGPDYATGYGNINGHRAIGTITDNRFLLDNVQADETKNFSITVPENAKNLKFTLVWTDVPTTANSNLALVNDLDMRISKGTSMIYFPWVLDSSSSIEALETPATTGEDHLNNIEQVFIENPEEGEYTISIQAFDINTAAQDFSIAYEWDLKDNFSWNYPLVNDNFPYNGETVSYFRWESSFENAAGTLSISYDNGISWEVINDQLPVDDRFYLWQPPEDLTSTAIVKMTIDGQDFLSDTFVISNAISLRVGLNCEDIVQLVWNKQEGVQNYRVHNLNGSTLEALTTSADTTFVFDKNSIASNYFSIQPILEDGTPGIIGMARDYESFEAGCYESTLIAEISDDQTTGELSISLSSLFNVTQIDVEKWNGSTFESIGVLSENTLLNFIYLDESPDQGLNTYRIKITTTDGMTFFSDEAELFFLTTTPFATFPNPVSEGITVFTKDFPDERVWMEIYSLDGRILMSTEITSEQQFVILTSLRQGIYALSLYSEKSNERLAKLIYKL